MKGLTPGRIVHYVLPDGLNAGTHRPAMIVHIWNQSADGEPDYATVNLNVFYDGTNDYAPEEIPSGYFWATSVQYDPDKSPSSWHWIEPA